MAIKKTKKQVQVKEITIDERGQAMNDIAVLFCNNKQMAYSEIQRHFDFTVSGILLEMELAGLIYQKHYECYVLVEETVEETVEATVEETVEEVVEEVESKTNLHKETDNARQKWLEYAEKTRQMFYVDKAKFCKMAFYSHNLKEEYIKLLHKCLSINKTPVTETTGDKIKQLEKLYHE